MKLLDTTFLIDYWAGTESAEAYLEAHEETDSFVSTTVNLKELAVGRAMTGRSDRNELLSTFGWLAFLPFDEEAAFHAADLEADLRSDPDVTGERLNALAGDVLIGAVARAVDAPVVTRNVEDFEALDGVAVEAY